MDALLDEEPFAAVAALPYSTRLFNSGVFAFEPSVAVASALSALSRATDMGLGSMRSGVRIRGAMEMRGTSHLSDQSVLNHYYKGRWRPLPYGYCGQAHLHGQARAVEPDAARHHPPCGPAQAVGRAAHPDPARRAAQGPPRRDAAVQ